MNMQTARNVLRGELNKGVSDGALKTAMEIAVESMDNLMVIDWHESRAGAGLELREYLGYTKEEYDEKILKIRNCPNLVTLKINYYAGSDLTQFDRQINFTITREALQNTLEFLSDFRHIDDFLSSYDDQDADKIYSCIEDTGRKWSESIIYGEAFEKAYDDYIREFLRLNPDTPEDEYPEKEYFYFEHFQK